MHCEECGKGFNQRRTLDHHMETHHLRGNFTCEYCEKAKEEEGKDKEAQTGEEKEEEEDCEDGIFRCELANEMYLHVTTEHPSVEFE